MSIRYKNIAIGRNGNTSWLVKRIWSIPGRSFLSDHHQYFAGRTQLQDFLAHQYVFRVGGGHAAYGDLVIRIGCPKIPILIDGEPVRMRE